MVLRLLGLPKQSLSRLPANRRGGILVLSLWSICLLSTFAVILSNGVRQKIILVQRLDERGKLHFIAEAGIKKAIIELKKEAEKTYDSLNDNWSNNTASFKAVGVGGGTFNVSYNYPHGKTGVIDTRYGLIDEERKININTADRAILERLFRVALNFHEIEAQELAASLIDWRDSDSELSIPLGSAEDRYYRNLQYPYEAKDAAFEVLEEVLLVNGMTRDIFKNIRYYVTIYGNGRINVNTAPKEVFLALRLDEKLVDKILLFRQGEDGATGTIDDNIFDAHSRIVPKLSQYFHLSDSEVAQLTRVVDHSLVTRSENFMIRSVAKLNNRKNTTEVDCVVNRDGKILYWHEP
ncbi:general secretion pathway protein GspK [Candidatus Omnitrophota bacterium]